MEENVKKNEKRVELFIPRESGDAQIGVNGKMYLLPKGKTSLVPPEVAAEYRRAQAAAGKAEESKETLMNQTK